MMGGYLCVFLLQYDSDTTITFKFRSDSNSDTCKHSMFAHIGIGITMFNIVIPNYFPALVSFDKITL